jgi:hypothetical protein
MFVVARNPDPESRLPYLLRLPLEGGLLLKARDTWPRSARVFCSQLEEGWPDGAEIVEEVAVTSCRRRGAAIDLVLDRPRLFRSQFVFTQVRGRPAIFWQTQASARRANPGGRVPRGKPIGQLTVLVDTRERYPYRFAGRSVQVERAALPAGDYAVRSGECLVASVERKTLEGLLSSASDGTLSFQMQKLAAIPAAAVVVEAHYSDLYREPLSRGSWIADVLARLAVRYAEVGVTFADSRRFAEEWTYRFLAAAVEDSARELSASPPSSSHEAQSSSPPPMSGTGRRAEG